MPRPIILLTMCTAVACTAPAPPPSSEHAAPQPLLAIDTVPGQPPALDLSGAWATGSVAEPDVRQVVLQLQCNYSPALWVMDQRGDTVRAWAIPESRAQGIAQHTPASTVGAEGRLRGVNLRMSLGSSRYVLRYDSTSGHLRGTLNGAPFWAVRQDIVRPQGCIAVP